MNQPDKSGAGILVVDDDAFMLKLLQRILTLQGFTRITTCLSGQGGLDAFDQAPTPIALVLLDLNMPEMDGIQFVRHLVKRKFSGSIILISGEDERMLITAQKLVEAHRINILGHLQKPVTQETLAAALVKWELLPANAFTVAKEYTAEDLRIAIADGQLVNYYQPKVIVSTGRVIGVEVLARWNHPSDGLVVPDQFISLAEDNGLIDDLAHNVLNQALAQHIIWAKQRLNLPLAVNLSMENLASLEFADKFTEQVVGAGILPKDVTLEITESRAMKDPVITLDTLTRLRLKRFVLAIDDFGTGHSSLAQLRDIPFDEFKIDKSFVHRAWADNRIKVMFDTSLSLAKQLGMKAVAEGVENANDWEFLRKTECDYAQGYFIGRPMLAEAVPAWVAAWEERVRRELIPEPVTQVAAVARSDKGTILIVEDHEFQRRIQSKILREEGYNVVTAASGTEALQLLRTLRPMLIVLDIELPDFGGLEITRRLRSTAIFKVTPILILSGTKDGASESLKAGANLFMAKPFERQTLVDKVKLVMAAIKKK